MSKLAYLYDPSDYDLKKGWFPFRNNHFVVNSEKVCPLTYCLLERPAYMTDTIRHRAKAKGKFIAA